MIGHSRLGGSDVLADDLVHDVERAVGKDNRVDIAHVYAAYLNRCDYFVTEDTKAFIVDGKRQRLDTLLGLRIRRTSELLEELQRAMSEAKRPNLEAERARCVGILQPPTPAVALSDLPTSPGLYSLWPASESVTKELGLREIAREESLVTRPLYVGKAQDSIAKRVGGKHFASGDTGHSTVRRTFAALLRFEGVPRATKIAHPSEKQLRVLTANFSLSPEDDERLTNWLSRNLIVRAVASEWVPLKSLEHAVGALLKPPLDQDRPPMWVPNPWRAQVEEARRQVQAQVRRSVETA